MPNESAPKMDGAQVPRREISDTRLATHFKAVLSSRRTREGCWEAVCGRPRVEQPLVQILVVVANTQVENVLLEDRSGEGFHINSKYI